MTPPTARAEEDIIEQLRECGRNKYNDKFTFTANELQEVVTRYDAFRARAEACEQDAKTTRESLIEKTKSLGALATVSNQQAEQLTTLQSTLERVRALPRWDKVEHGAYETYSVMEPRDDGDYVQYDDLQRALTPDAGGVL